MSNATIVPVPGSTIPMPTRSIIFPKEGEMMVGGDRVAASQRHKLDTVGMPPGLYQEVRDDLAKLSSQPFTRVAMRRSRHEYVGVMDVHGRPFTFTLNSMGFRAASADDSAWIEFDRLMDLERAAGLAHRRDDADVEMKMISQDFQKSNRLKGGKADKKKPSDFDAKKLAAGTTHEMEHTNDRSIAQEIAMDHLTEDSNYYRKLSRVEKAIPKKDKSAKPVKKTPNKKASTQVAGATGKVRYNYPQDKDPKKTQSKTDPVKVPATADPTEHRVDPQELANQLQIPVTTLKTIARRFHAQPKLGQRKGFISFMRTHLKAFAEKHKLDGDYFGLLYDAFCKGLSNAKTHSH